MTWRDTLPIHPAADLFPLLSKDELIELGNDIKKNGPTSWIAVSSGEPNAKPMLLDGRNRLDALELIGLEIAIYFNGGDVVISVTGADTDFYLPRETIKTDPYAYVISANAHRRHLTPDQKRKLVRKVLDAKPELSDRAIGKLAKVDHKTVADVRSKANGEIPHKDRTEAPGRKARGRKPGTKAAAVIEEQQRDNVAKHTDPMHRAEHEPLNSDKSTEPFDDIVMEIQIAVDAAMDEVPPAKWEYLFVDLHNMLRNLLEARTSSRAKAAWTELEPH
jgi:hypothetical protein